MKKWIAFLLIFVLGFTLIACKDKIDDGDNVVKPTGMTVEASKTEIKVGEKIKLTIKITPENADQSVTFDNRHPNIVSVSEDGTVEGKAPGIAEIVVISKANNRLTKSIEITVVEEVADPTGVKIQTYATEVMVGRTLTLRAKVEPANAKQDVVWESSDDTIAIVDANTGVVTGVNIGEVTITAKVIANLEIKASITITVTEYKEDLSKPEQIKIIGENKLEEGVMTTLQAIVLPYGVSQNVEWSSSDPSIATVDKRGVVTAISAGKVIITAASKVALDIIAEFEIEVIAAAALPERKNLQGYTITLMAAGHAMYEHDPFLDGYASVDRQAKQKAWREVENLYNCKVEVIAFPDYAPWGPSRVRYLTDKSSINQAETDFFVSTTDWLSDLVNGKAVVDVTDFYAKYGKNSMPPFIKAASTYNGRLYAVTTGTTPGTIYPYHGLFFNVALLEKHNLENPAKLFNEGQWTWSKFQEYVGTVSAALDEDETVFAGKPAGLYYGMVNAAGVSLVDPANLRLNFNHKYAVEAARIIRNLYETYENLWGTNAWDEKVDTFVESKTLFAVAEYWFLKTDNRFKKDMWGEDTRFGYVPFPYPDALDKEDTRVSYQGGAIYQMQSGREWNYPAGVTAEDIYRAFTEIFILTQKNMYEDVEFNEEVLMKRAAESKLDDSESIKAIIFFKANNVIWDMFYSIQPSWSHAGPMIDKIVVDGDDYYSVVEEYFNDFNTKMREVYGGN